MATAKSWIDAARPRTLPLAVSGILMGAALAYLDGGFQPVVTGLAILTAVCIQIFSNFANDYGDSQKGTDNQHRIGPLRTVQSGAITPAQMRVGMTILILASLLSGIALVVVASQGLQIRTALLFIAFGVLALVAAYRYTAGNNPYGYAGFGDLAVFLFFGLLPVAGTYFLNTHRLTPEIFLPAITIGVFSTGVLNLNNMRDVENDRNSGKRTLAVRMGSRLIRGYHLGLITVGWVSILVFAHLRFLVAKELLFILTLPLFVLDLIRIGRIEVLKDLDPFLKKLALSTLLFTLLFGIGIILSIG